MNERIKQLLLLGREHYEKREFDQAEQLLREVLGDADRYADVHNMLGVICHGRGNFVQAEHHFERALELNASYTEAALNLAVTYNDRGKYEKAREVYARIRVSQTGPDQGLDPFARGKIANMHSELGQAYADAGLAAEAIHELEKATALCPQFADLQTKLGTLLREQSDLAGAKARYEAALHARPNYVPARIQLGVTLLSLGNALGATEAWQQVLTVEPENSQAKMYLRMVERQKSQPPPGDL